MTAVCHHLHGEKLTSHAAGTLDPPLSAVLRRHVRFCERCRARLCALDNLGGAFLEGPEAPEDE
ncbi:MAG: zf-HC2 domain-containing protein [Rhodomicrobium sp.]